MGGLGKKKIKKYSKRGNIKSEIATCVKKVQGIVEEHLFWKRRPRKGRGPLEWRGSVG